MKLSIIAVGARMPDWVDTAWADYAKRLPPEWSVTLRDVKPEPRTTGRTAAQMMAAEARRIEAAIPSQAIRVALDERGRDLNSHQFATLLGQWHEDGQPIALLVGGPDGLDAALKASCQSCIRISSMTMPHPLVRVVLIEQIYRAWSILSSHPYHRD